MPPNDSRAHALRAALEPLAPLDDATGHPSEARLAGYLSRELDERATDELERHLAACERCAAELVAVASVEDELALQSERIAADGAAAAATATQVRTTSAASARADATRRPPLPAPARTARPRRGRTLLRIAAGFTLVLGALVVAAAAGSSVLLQRLAPTLIAGMSDTIGRQVSGSGASLVLAGGPGIRLDDLTIAEDPQFGTASFAQVRSAALHLDPGALLRGQVRGAIHLDEPTVHLSRDATGRWNVETLSGKGLAKAALNEGVTVSGGQGKAAGAKERAVRLTSASVEGGVLEISDRGRDVTLRDVDLSYRSSDPTAPATIQLTSTVGGDAHRVALRGEIGPFEGTTEPRYRLDEVLLSKVALDDIPGAPENLTGELTFKGTLASEGSGFETVVMNAAGDGDLGLANGELRERNLTAELLAALTQHASGDAAATAADVLERARRSPALAAVLALDTTPFEDIAGAVAIAGGTVSFDGLAVETSLFNASAAGSVSRAGAIEAQGTLALTPAATAAIVALLPETQRLFGTGAKLEVPFSVAGAWPDVDVKVDVRTAIARLVQPLDPRTLTLLPRLAG